MEDKSTQGRQESEFLPQLQPENLKVEMFESHWRTGDIGTGRLEVGWLVQYSRGEEKKFEREGGSKNGQGEFFTQVDSMSCGHSLNVGGEGKAQKQK